MSRSVGWYARRLRQMSPAEVGARLGAKGRQLSWARLQVPVGEPVPPPPGVLPDRSGPPALHASARDAVPDDVCRAVLGAADRVLEGDWTQLGATRDDIAAPDWFLDQVTGRRAPQTEFAFRIDHRDEQVTGNVKQVWEVSRHHHLTLLASAWWLSGDERYAQVVDAQLRSWWRENPPLSGIHWTSGIELGVRLVSWAWVRRLLDDWPGVRALFEDCPEALAQIWWHQHYLAAFPSPGSSANNHAVAEEVGRLVAACAFPWYSQSDAWRADATHELARHLRANTFPSGLNKELATDYHRFVTELGLVAVVEAAAAGHDAGTEAGLWELLTASLDAAAAVVDASGRPPRQGDGDEGRALVVDDPAADPWGLLLGAGAQTVGAVAWWPEVSPGVLGVALGHLLAAAPGTIPAPARPSARPSVFADAGMALLRSPAGADPEIWCRCDGGPHGFLSIAAHAHADALSVEVRHGGVEILADPGTYCYHGEPEWRSYFRSTRAHNTIEVDGANQSEEGGPFLWSRHAETVVERVEAGPELAVQTWAAYHTGYDPAGVRHAREVTLDQTARTLTVADRLVGGAGTARLSFHLGPAVDVRLDVDQASLTWENASGVAVEATLGLPSSLSWSVHRGEESPVLGWYSPGFGERVPASVLVGVGPVADNRLLTSTLTFHDTTSSPEAGG